MNNVFDCLKPEILKIILKYEWSYTKMIKSRYTELYKFLYKSNERFSESLFLWLNPTINNNCKMCGKKTNYQNIKYGYLEYCSSKCSNSNKEVQEKKKAKCIQSFGVENPSQSDIVKSRKKETFIEHFGVDCNLKLKTTQNNIKQTNLRKYGSEYHTSSNHYKKQRFITTYNNLLKSSKFTNISPNFKMEDFKGVEKTYEFVCKKCDNIFKDHLQDGRIPICRKCNPVIQSVSEKEIYEYLLPFCSDIIMSDRKILNGKELDMYIPSKKIAIEFNGNYYHSEVYGGVGKEYHINKTKLCEAKGIKLVHIFEDEWLFKQNIVKSKLLNILGENKNKIYARKCEIKEVSYNTSKDFLEQTHIQGSAMSSIHIGLFHDSILIGVMTFGSLRKSLGSRNIDGYYELYRYSTSKRIVGGASKLLKYFIKKYKPNKIISYADRRWTNTVSSNVYKETNFKLIGITKPNYFYTKDHVHRQHRFNFRKSELSKKLKVYDPNITEWENMQLNGYDRIWDCGHLKYEWSDTNKLSNIN